MKIKLSIIVIFLFSNLYSQKLLNILITVDENICASYNLSESFLIIGKDTVKLKYEIGRFMIEQKDFETLLLADRLEQVILNFKYFRNCPFEKEISYSIKLKLDLILQDYLLLKIYNYDLYSYLFKKKEGYIFGYNSPINSLGIPNASKIKRNPCVDQ